jgi:peptidoglycan-N-acetylglucosamine deacetylase
MDKNLSRRNFVKGILIGTSSLCLENVWGQESKVIMEELEDPFKEKPSLDKILITIDDGPKNSMEKMLIELKGNPSIFFVLGSVANSLKGFDLLSRALNQGSEIGNHSYNHPEYSRISISRGIGEIERTQEIIKKVYDKEGLKMPLLFRFPYGDDGFWISDSGKVNGSKEKELAYREYFGNKGYDVFHWDCDTNDWRYYSKNKWSKKSIMSKCRGAKNGDIVLMHDNVFSSVNLIPFFVRNYKLVKSREDLK